MIKNFVSLLFGSLNFINPRGAARIFPLRKPLGEGSLYAAQIVCVGSHSFPGEGAVSWVNAMKSKRDLCRYPGLRFPNSDFWQVSHKGGEGKNKKGWCRVQRIKHTRHRPFAPYII
jgi:hypothetical protein